MIQFRHRRTTLSLTSVLLLLSVGGCAERVADAEIDISHSVTVLNLSPTSTTEPTYSLEPPCKLPDPDMDTNAPWPRLIPKCSRNEGTHVSYWTSRPDIYGIACKEHPQYCDPLMAPHCHGYGNFRFCHAHPGGEFRHDHISPTPPSVPVASVGAYR